MVSRAPLEQRLAPLVHVRIKYAPLRVMHFSRNLLTRVRVIIMPILKDNYSYLLVNEDTRQALVVDPADPEVIMPHIQSNQLDLVGILCTHHHWDHAGGNESMKKHFPDIAIHGSDPRIPCLTRLLSPHDANTPIKVCSSSLACQH